MDKKETFPANRFNNHFEIQVIRALLIIILILFHYASQVLYFSSTLLFFFFLFSYATYILSVTQLVSRIQFFNHLSQILHYPSFVFVSSKNSPFLLVCILSAHSLVYLSGDHLLRFPVKKLIISGYRRCTLRKNFAAYCVSIY